MREDPDVDAFGRANEAEHGIAEHAIPPAVVGTVPNENLCDSFLTSKFDNRGYGVVAFQHFGRGFGFFRRIEIFSNRDLFPLGPSGLARVFLQFEPFQSAVNLRNILRSQWSAVS